MKKLISLLMSAVLLFGTISAVNLTSFAVSGDTEEISINITFGQTEARTILDKINTLRTSAADSWYWSYDNKNKVYCSNLSELQYDYELEKIAMQRAAEIAVSLSNKRPNGKNFWTVYDEFGYVCDVQGENIAVDFETAEDADNNFRADDQGFAGQSNRRNMLNSSFKAVGIAHIYYNSRHFWVEEFSDKVKGTELTVANDSNASVSVEISSSLISNISLKSSVNSFNLNIGEAVDLPSVTVWAEFGPVNADKSFSLDNDSVIQVENGKITAMGLGSAKLIVKSINNSVLEIPVTVICSHKFECIKHIEPTCSADGRDTYKCSICGYTYETTALREIIIPSDVYPESQHNYGANADELYKFSYEDAYKYEITFSDDTSTENGFDFITVYDADDNIIVSGSGKELAGKTVAVNSCSFKIGLKSDSVNQDYGFKIVLIKATAGDSSLSKDNVPHTVVTDEAVAPTCTEAGLTQGSHCAVCGKIIVAQSSVAAAGHKWSSGIITKSASCSEYGEITYTCAVCNAVKTEQTEKLKHTAVTDEAVAPACTEAGLTQGSHCSVCGKVLIKQEIVNALGHTPVSDMAVAPTCSKTGLTEGSHCSVCNEIIIQQQVIEKTAHIAEWNNESGRLVKRCIDCKSEVSRLRFEDLSEYVLYGDYVEYTSLNNNFISGTNPPYYTLFSPKVSVTREMFVAILYRMAGSPYDNGNNPYTYNPFTDISTNAYYYNAACWALDEGVTNQTTFNPTADITREQTARFLFAYVQSNNMLGDEAYKNVDLSDYPDYNSVHSWAIEPLQWANYNNMITGTQQGYINPQGATQRIHATRILYGFGVACNIGNFE